MWRFDQGRLDYFRFDEIKNLARGLARIDGIDKPTSPNADVIRQIMSKYTHLPFYPDSYYVWRNYKRVFGCLLLASEVNGKIVATDLCRSLASAENIYDCDDYLGHFSRAFYYPSPVFQGYRETENRVFPVIALLKYMFAGYCFYGKEYISVSDIINILVANRVTGLESLEFYSGLLPVTYSCSDDEQRQVRELVRFVSQFSFLAWNNPNLYLCIKDKKEMEDIIGGLMPILGKQEPDSGREVIRLGSAVDVSAIGKITLTPYESIESEFTEGSKIRVTHIRTERSSKLKSFYFDNVVDAAICRMCQLDTAIKYPWAEHVIELHHLLPLSSPIRFESGKTSIKDIVGLCPTCHSATHKYYSWWFKEAGQKDFESYAQAVKVYEQARGKVFSV